MESLDNPTAHCVALMLLGVGSTLVLSSFLALGFTGTFLGKSRRAEALQQSPLDPGEEQGWVLACPQPVAPAGGALGTQLPPCSATHVSVGHLSSCRPRLARVSLRSWVLVAHLAGWLLAR